MKKQRSEIKEGNSVSHPILGEGEVIGIISSADKVPIYAIILFDRDPSREYNMETNPCIQYISTLTLIHNEQ